MYRYDWHIGDFRKSTRGLSVLDRGVYREMLDELYDTEKPLPLDENLLFDVLVMKRSAERESVRRVLKLKWVQTTECGGGYIQKRAWSEILYYKELCQKKVIAGRSGGVARHRQMLDKRQADAKPALGTAKQFQAPLDNHHPLSDNHHPPTATPVLPADGLAAETAHTLPDGVEFPEGFPPSPQKAVEWVHGLGLPSLPPEAYVHELWFQAVGRDFKDGADVRIQRFAHWVNGRWMKEESTWKAKRSQSAEKKEWAGFSPSRADRPGVAVRVRTHVRLPEPPCDWRLLLRDLYPAEEFPQLEHAAAVWGLMEPDVRRELEAEGRKRGMLSVDWVQPPVPAE